MSIDQHDHPGTGETFEAVLSNHLSRRKVLGGSALLGAAAIAAPLFDLTSAAATELGATERAYTRPTRGPKPDLAFADVASAASTSDEWRIPEGYVGGVLMAWGDPIHAGEPEKAVTALTAADQVRRFGYNADYIAYFPLRGENRGLLWVNHEYTEGARMFPGYVAANATAAQVGVELTAHGGTVIEIEKVKGGWRPILSSRYNRRIDAVTPMKLTGPAAGHRLLRTKDDPTGTTVLGMLNNCGGGVTPWGTVLTAEENFNQYFANTNNVADATTKASHTRYGVTAASSERRWENHVERFDAGKVPNEPNRFGWVVEIDPSDPNSVPKKRTALGRFKHEAATVVLAKDGRPVVYSGDDERFDYVYKFVAKNKFNRRNRAANMDLLDEGTLFVAKFNDDGTGNWIAVEIANPALAGKFDSQAEVLIRCREACDLLGATKMDRPEDIETNPINKRVYLAMTNNTNRGVATNAGHPTQGTNSSNPRANNRFGHIIELTETGDDPAAPTFKWGVFMLCGPKSDASRRFGTIADATNIVDISCPDNLAFDSRGNLWISSDGQPGTIQKNDGLYAVVTQDGHPERGKPRLFSTVPAGAECTGPYLTAGDTSLFFAVQHPGESGTMAAPQSLWPDYVRGVPARAGVVWVTKAKGGKIGS